MITPEEVKVPKKELDKMHEEIALLKLINHDLNNKLENFQKIQLDKLNKEHSINESLKAANAELNVRITQLSDSKADFTPHFLSSGESKIGMQRRDINARIIQLRDQRTDSKAPLLSSDESIIDLQRRNRGYKSDLQNAESNVKVAYHQIEKLRKHNDSLKKQYEDEREKAERYHRKILDLKGGLARTEQVCQDQSNILNQRVNPERRSLKISPTVMCSLIVLLFALLYKIL